MKTSIPPDSLHHGIAKEEPDHMLLASEYKYFMLNYGMTQNFCITIYKTQKWAVTDLFWQFR